MAVLAGTLAVFLAWLTVPIFLQVAPPNVPRLDLVGIAVPTVLFTAGACLFSALACGLAPAIRFSYPRLTRLREGAAARRAGAIGAGMDWSWDRRRWLSCY